MVGLEPLEGFLEHLHGDTLVAAVGANLGHQHDAVALTLERGAEPLFAGAIVIIPGIVEEVNAGIQGTIDDSFGLALVFRRPEMVSADSDDGNLHARAAQGSLRNRARDVILSHKRASRGNRHGCGFDKFSSAEPHCFRSGYGWPVFWVAPTISRTSTDCMSSGNSWAMRASGLSNFNESL